MGQRSDVVSMGHAGKNATIMLTVEPTLQQGKAAHGRCNWRRRGGTGPDASSLPRRECAARDDKTRATRHGCGGILASQRPLKSVSRHARAGGSNDEAFGACDLRLYTSSGQRIAESNGPTMTNSDHLSLLRTIFQEGKIVDLPRGQEPFEWSTSQGFAKCNVDMSNRVLSGFTDAGMIAIGRLARALRRSSPTYQRGSTAESFSKEVTSHLLRRLRARDANASAQDDLMDLDHALQKWFAESTTRRRWLVPWQKLRLRHFLPETLTRAHRRCAQWFLWTFRSHRAPNVRG